MSFQIGFEDELYEVDPTYNSVRHLRTGIYEWLRDPDYWFRSPEWKVKRAIRKLRKRALAWDAAAARWEEVGRKLQ